VEIFAGGVPRTDEGKAERGAGDGRGEVWRVAMWRGGANDEGLRKGGGSTLEIQRG
jgi:hypothetical protein